MFRQFRAVLIFHVIIYFCKQGSHSFPVAFFTLLIMPSLPINSSSESRPESAPTDSSTVAGSTANGSFAIGFNPGASFQSSSVSSPPKTIKNGINAVTPEGSNTSPSKDHEVDVVAKRNLEPSLNATIAVPPASVPPKKKSKPSKIDINDLDLKSTEGIKRAYISLKGEHETIPSDLITILRDVFDSYTVPILKVLHTSLFGEEWKSGLKADLINKLSSKYISNDDTTSSARDSIPHSSSASLPIDSSISSAKEVPRVLKIR